MTKQELLNTLEDLFSVYKDNQPFNPNAKTVFIDTGQIGVQYSLKIYKDQLQISFRGTDSLRDVLTDVRFWKKVIPYNNNDSKIRVHTGFIDAYKNKEVRETIHKYVSEDINNIFVMGHSYGGALAVLCAVDLQYNFPNKNYEVALFGCPRLGNKAFANSYDNRIFKTYRVENSNDIVTKIPFGIMGYKHVGIRIHIGLSRKFWRFSIKNHRIQDYYEYIWKMI